MYTTQISILDNFSSHLQSIGPPDQPLNHKTIPIQTTIFYIKYICIHTYKQVLFKQCVENMCFSRGHALFLIVSLLVKCPDNMSNTGAYVIKVKSIKVKFETNKILTVGNKFYLLVSDYTHIKSNYLAVFL